MDSNSSQLSEAMKIAMLPESERIRVLSSLTREEAKALNWDWKFWGRPAQMEPEGSWWNTWLVMAGRGFGKTRLGSEWVRSLICGRTPMAAGRVSRIALVAETAADGRDVMVQGRAGILATHPPDFRPRYVKSDRALYWPNGAIALLFSAEDPEQLRGPEHEAAWCDELAKWRYARDTWDMLQFGLRIGDNPRQLVTTTPRPIPLLRHLLSEEGKSVVVTRGRTFDNAANLASSFVGQMKRRYEGTRLGRQELDAELLDDVKGALWSRSMLERRTEANRTAAGMSIDDAHRVPPLRRIVVGVDPSGSRGDVDPEEATDDIGIVVVGEADDDVYYVLEDATVNGSPDEWGRSVVSTFRKRQADLVVAEENYGGAMVQYTIRTVDRKIPYKPVRASRGKHVRAEPVAALYEQGKVRHVGAFPELEDQMCSMTRLGYEGKGSPDRLDALVWAITELAFGNNTYTSSDMRRAHG